MLAGILVDVSGSMKNSLQLHVERTDQDLTRAQSIFSTIMNIVNREVGYQEDHDVFALAFGLHDVPTCDLLALLDFAQTLDMQPNVNGQENLIRLLASNGAPFAGKYVREHLTEREAQFLYKFYSENIDEVREIIEQLPRTCKETFEIATVGSEVMNVGHGVMKLSLGLMTAGLGAVIAEVAEKSGCRGVADRGLELMNRGLELTNRGVGVMNAGFVGVNDGLREMNPSLGAMNASLGVMNAGRGVINVGSRFGIYSRVPSIEEIATREQASRAMANAKTAIRQRSLERLRTMTKPRSKTFQSTVNLLKEITSTSSDSSTAQQSLTSAQLSTLVDSIDPYIYGNTPMCEALRSALDAFSSSAHQHKVMFLLSDGESTDGNPAELATRFCDNNVLVFVCLLTSKNIARPRSLYYDADTQWTEAQRQMFELSSTVENTHSAMSVLLEQNWELPASGHSRLFIQANHPDVIKEFSNLIEYITESNDALLNIIGRVSLDVYINAAMSTFEPREQKGGTCYAHAVATVFHLAMRRIEGLENGVPDFTDICQKLIDEYGKNGAVTENVLNIWAPKYRLHYKKVDELGARQAINRRRPIVATFRLDEEQWKAFSRFYKDKPQGVLESKDLGMSRIGAKIDGHAVVLIKCDPTSLTFMNSWGAAFADGGFFRVRNQAVLNLQFYDVYWTLNDLQESETRAYRAKSSEVGQDMIQKIPKSIQDLPYECPKCHQSSPAITFIEHSLEVKCPKCHQNFKPTPLGLVVNSYTH